MVATGAATRTANDQHSRTAPGHLPADRTAIASDALLYSHPEIPLRPPPAAFRAERMAHHQTNVDKRYRAVTEQYTRSTCDIRLQKRPFILQREVVFIAGPLWLRCLWGDSP
jgi:hypothetical protein